MEVEEDPNDHKYFEKRLVVDQLHSTRKEGKHSHNRLFKIIIEVGGETNTKKLYLQLLLLLLLLYFVFAKKDSNII